MYLQSGATRGLPAITPQLLVVSIALPVLFALPWIGCLAVTLIRARHSRTLDEENAEVSSDAPLVSLVIPARNEAHNIARCLESALASSYPFLEVILVDDHSSDDTGAIARRIAAGDSRLSVLVPPPLPPGWFGKQWACTSGAAAARGAILGFMDADTWQAADLIPRLVNAMGARRSDLLTIGGRQELGSFWERLLQPLIFCIMLMRYGGTEDVNRSPRASDKIANGQCLFVRRSAYDAIGGHAAVRDVVAEDLALAQRFFLAGFRTTLLLGLSQLSTRMYTSLRELVEGWGKNMYAGGRHAMPLGAVGRALFPFLLVLPALSGVVPPIVLLLGAFGAVGKGVLLWSALVTGANLVWWLLVYSFLDMSPGYAVLHPLGSAVLLYINVRAIARGGRVEWKGREYRSA